MVKSFTFNDEYGDEHTSYLEDRGWRIHVESKTTNQEWAFWNAILRIEELEKRYLPEPEWTTGKKYEEPSDE